MLSGSKEFERERGCDIVFVMTFRARRLWIASLLCLSLLAGGDRVKAEMKADEQTALAARAAKAHLAPLSGYVERLSRDKPDTTEVSYVGLRCWAVYTALGAFFQGNARNAEDRATGDKLIEQGQDFLFVATMLDASVNRKSKEVIADQMALLPMIYMHSIVENKKINNSVLSDLVERDIEIAKSLRPLFGRLATTIRERSSQSGSK